MKYKIAHVTYLVSDYDEAITWFKNALDFSVYEDTALGGAKRWVVVGPASKTGTSFLLAKADGAEQVSHIGKAAGGRVAFFLHTDDFARDHAAMQSKGVKFMESPRQETYGTVAVFEDIYGNKWDLLQPKP